MSQTVTQAATKTGAGRKILVIDDMPFCRELVSEAMRSHGFVPITACNGAEGIAVMEQHAIRLVICDVEMPVMNGLEFMKTLRARKEWQNVPVILLTSSMQRDRIVEAGRLKAAEYLLKGNFSLDLLMSRVKRWLEQPHESASSTPAPSLAQATGAAEPAPEKEKAPVLPKLLERDQLLAAIAAGADGIKTLPGLQHELKSLLGNAHPSTAALTALIRQDPVATVRLVQQVNTSNPSGNKGPVTSVEEAVRALGPQGIGAAVEGMASRKDFSKNDANGLPLLRLCQHSVLVGTVLSQIVPRSSEITPGATYLIGLCHDLAQVALRHLYPNEFGAAIDFAAQAKLPVCQLLPDVFGVNFGELTRQLLAALKLPSQLTEPICEHAEFEAGGKAPQSHLGSALRLANEFANALQLVPSLDEAFVRPLSQAECRTARIMTAPLNGAELRSDAIMGIQSLSQAAALEADLRQPVALPSKPKVWYMRHSSFSSLDPFGQALDLLSRMDSGSALPGREEAADLQGLVVCTPSLEHGGTPFSSVERWLAVPRSKPVKVLFAVDDPAAAERSTPEIRTIRLPISMGELVRCLQWLAS